MQVQPSSQLVRIFHNEKMLGTVWYANGMRRDGTERMM